MSLQVGHYYRDNRPVTEDHAETIRESLVAEGHAAPQLWRSGGVCMGYADFAFRHTDWRAQPMVTNRASITFDGRLDKRDDLRLALPSVLCGDTNDAAMALAVYQRWGADGLVRLIGDWSLAIWDADRKEMVLASDYAGTRPLYYTAESERVLWSTQLKPLVEWVQPRELDELFIASALVRGGCPGRTPYRGIHSLPPGHYLTASDRGIQIRRFWRPPTGSLVRYTRESDYEERLQELFREAVSSRLDTDFPVLSELSGGLDSSSIVCMAREVMVNGGALTPRLVTLSYERDGSLDRRFYEVVEKWCGFEGTRLSTTELRYLAEGHVGDAAPAAWSKLHTAVASGLRQLGARTMLTGLLGDLIMGNLWNDSTQIADRIWEGRWAAAGKEALVWSKALRIPIWGILRNAMLTAMPPAIMAGREELFADGLPTPGDKEDSLTPAFRVRTAQAACHELFSPEWKEARPSRRKHICGLIEVLELRRLQPSEPLTNFYWTHPYAHRPLVEYLLSVPAWVVCGPGEPRRLMRRAFRSLWPPELRERKSKDSFGGTFLDALRPLIPPLVKHVKELQMIQRGFVDPVSLKSRLERMQHSLECNTGQLRHLILLELWLQGSRFGGGQSSASA